MTLTDEQLADLERLARAAYGKCECRDNIDGVFNATRCERCRAYGRLQCQDYAPIPLFIALLERLRVAEARVAELEQERAHIYDDLLPEERRLASRVGRAEERAAVVASARATADLVAFVAPAASALRTFANGVELREHLAERPGDGEGERGGNGGFRPA